MRLDLRLDRDELERLFLAHCLADATKLGRARDARLSPAGCELRENLLRAPNWRILRELGLALNAQGMGAPDDTVRLARTIDATTAAELGRYDFGEILTALGGHLGRRAELEAAWERDLRRMQA